MASCLNTQSFIPGTDILSVRGCRIRILGIRLGAALIDALSVGTVEYVVLVGAVI